MRRRGTGFDAVEAQLNEAMRELMAMTGAPEVPSRPVAVFVYDDGCGPCSRFVTFMRSRIDGDRVRFMGGRAYRGPGAELTDRTALLVTDQGVRIEQDAIGGLLRRARWPWCWLGRIIVWRPLRTPARKVYRWVAGARHRLPVSACALDLPEAPSPAPQADQPPSRHG
ncbi:hypothetical protein MANAM107_02950 [Actinomyces capricornis]|uniref:DUF393 domain-containing protein n=2 Tax=Actinomyces capricornis TaxID=2755559 RepID=A0ABM7U7M9_9ACTO|nr:hypothetical protein MANAM107_02950 [Actinomyces capricornis]